MNWSVGIEQKLPAEIYASVNFLDKRDTNDFVYALQSPPPALYGTYLLNNSRTENYHSVDVNLRHTFAHGYVLFGSYTRSSARTNAALEYIPTLSVLGPQASGPLPWDVPNRFFSWGWLPVPKLKSWDFVYTADWRTGFPFTSVARQSAGRRRARLTAFSRLFLPKSGTAVWRFHLRGYYFGLRGVIENIN